MSLLTCAQCGATFERPHGRGPIPRFCSGACRQAALRVRNGSEVSGLQVQAMRAEIDRLRAQVERDRPVIETAVALVAAEAAHSASVQAAWAAGRMRGDPDITDALNSARRAFRAAVAALDSEVQP